VSEFVLIDLGLIGREPTAEPVPREGWLAANRGWLAVATVAALLATAGAASAPARPELVETRVAAGVGHDARVIGDQLYVVGRDVGSPGTGGRTVSAYQLPDAELKWRVPLPLPGGSRWIVAAPTAVLIASETDRGPVTVAFDSATGRLLWRRAAIPLGAAGVGDVVLVKRPAGDHGWRDTGGRVAEAVDAQTGRAVWSYPLPEVTQEVLTQRDGRLARAVIGVPRGWVEVRDLATGRLLAGRQLLPPPDAGRVSRFQPWLHVAGDLVIVGEAGAPTAAFDVDTLQPRWTADLDLSTVFVSGACGSVICAVGREGGLRAVDAATGHLRWSSARLGFARAYRGVLVTVAEGEDRTETPVLEVVDPRTGFPMRELGRWRLVAAGPGEPPITIRHDSRTMRAWVGVLDEDAQSVRPLGVLPDVLDGCEAGAGWLTCRHIDGSIGVWRYR
jgi:outer membrane protein assembly factor BamB